MSGVECRGSFFDLATRLTGLKCENHDVVLPYIAWLLGFEDVLEQLEMLTVDWSS